MPNWTYLLLHFFHTLALALWVGGAAALAIIAAPVTFAHTPSREQAGRIVAAALRRFDLVVAGCIVALAVTSFLMVSWFGRWSPWYAIEYTCITLMSASALFSMLLLKPRMEDLRSPQPVPEAEAARRARFEELHRLATLSMQFNLACGTVAILFS